MNFGRSLIVPSVQELAKEHLNKIPPRYVHHPSVVSDADLFPPSVPVIHLQSLTDGDEPELDRLHTACQQWGFFQVR